MLIKLQFDRNTYDVIDVPNTIVEWYGEHRDEFYNRLMSWLREKGEPYYTNGVYCYYNMEVIEWFNDDLLKDSEAIAKIIAYDQNNPSDNDLLSIDF